MTFLKNRGPRTALALASVVTAAVALSGCMASDDGSSGELVTDPAKISGKLTFSTWWAYADQALIDGFTKQYPNVDVELQFTAIDNYPTKIQSLAASDDLPDVFAAQNATLTGLVDAGRLYDLNDALATAPLDGDAATWKESFVDELLTGANAGLTAEHGETWGVPFNAISVAAVYNEDAYQEAGVTPPADFAGLLENCRALEAAGYIPMSLTGKVWSGWWSALAWDQTMRDEDAADFSVDDPNYVKGFEIVKQMADAGCWDPSQISTDIDGETSLFLQKKTATFVTVPENFLQTVADGADFGLGAYVLPALDGVEPNRILGGGNANVLVINKDSKNLSAAVAFAKYLTSVEVEQQLAENVYTIPSIDIEFSAGGSDLMGAYVDATRGGFLNSSEYLPALTPEGQTKLQSEVLPALILGQITPEQAAQATATFYVQ